MNSIRTACYALSASALFLGGMLAQTLLAPAPAHAATVMSHSANTVYATAKIQQGEDGLFVLSGDTLSVYRTNVGGKKMELLFSRKINLGGKEEEAPKHGR